MNTPDYQLIESADEKLPAGTFVRPIAERYLPRDWKDYVPGAKWMWETEVVCYTPIGLRVIQRKNIRQV